MRTIWICSASLIFLSLGCRGNGNGTAPRSTNGTNETDLFIEVSVTHLPTAIVSGFSMDAGFADVDGDGDLDIIVAQEFRPNVLLINDGGGKFSDGSSHLPRTFHDSEDVGIADFDRDGDADIVIVSEDDQVNELYLNDGSGVFSDASSRLPVRGTSNAVFVGDINGDGSPDIVIGNNGQNRIIINDGQGQFSDETAVRLPSRRDITQDVEMGDADGDGNLDLLFGNEDANRLLLNDGSGVFADVPAANLPGRAAPEETREADFGDIDNDGDLDIVYGNVSAFVAGADPQNRLLVNQGGAVFHDETAAQLPAQPFRSFDIDFIDVDGDGDLDLVSSDAKPGRIYDEPYRVYRNDGSGNFSDATDEIFPAGVQGKGFDAEAGDLNGDGIIDLYLCSQGSVDRLLFGKR